MTNYFLKKETKKKAKKIGIFEVENKKLIHALIFVDGSGKEAKKITSRRSSKTHTKRRKI